VQAPKKRTPTHAGPDRRMLMLALFAASGVAMLVGVIAFLSLSGGSGTPSDADAKAAMLAAGCTFKSAPAKPYKNNEVHILEGTVIKYPTFPPSGGPHYGSPAIWDFYTEPVDPRLLVHNQEHGGVILWWGPDTPQSTVTELRSFYDSSPVSMAGSPLKGLGKRVAITAWTGDAQRYGSDPGYFGDGKAAVCPTFNEKAFKTFRDTYRGKGPEGISMDVNQPGT
jgi:uncharacterized protein DUF3105